RPQAARSDRVQPFGRIKVQVCQELHKHWQDVADLFEIPGPHRAKFDRGREPQGVWEWLDERGKLDDLAGALRELHLHHIAARLDPGAGWMEHPPSEPEGDGACTLRRSTPFAPRDRIKARGDPEGARCPRSPRASTPP